MKKFAFSLDKVLTYKEQIEHNLRAEYAQIVQKVAREEERLQMLEEEHAVCRMRYEEEKNRGSTIRQMKIYEGYLESVLWKIQKTEKIIDRLKAEEEKKRVEVIAAKTEASSIDRLKDKRKKEYNAAERKAEEIFVEEFVAHTSSAAARMG